MSKSRLEWVLKLIMSVGLGILLGGCGRVSLSITDAPVDDAEAVILAFTGVDIYPDEGDVIKLSIKPVKVVDLLTLTAGVSDLLLDNESLPQGKYVKVKLMLDLDASFVTVNGADYTMTLPDDAVAGLELEQEFEVKTSAESQLVIDFDLRKSLYAPENGNQEYILRPSLRMVDPARSGAIKGSVDASLLGLDNDCYDNNGAVTAAIYVFNGSDISPDDVDGNAIEPLSSARLQADLVYVAAYLEQGDYTVSLTCAAKYDDPATNDTIRFIRSRNITVIAKQTRIVDFGL